MSPTILLVEDDKKLAPLVQRFLEDHHFKVIWAADGEAGWQEYQRHSPDLVILDLMLPGKDGLSLCREIRAAGNPGVIILTAKGDEMDRILGLELGADDYLTKPFSLPELQARIRAILRRSQRIESQEEDHNLSRIFGEFTLDLEARALSRAGESIELTRSEFDILERLTRRPGKVFGRNELLESVRGGETEAFDRAVDQHISNLRSKIEADARQPVFIQTVWGVGYRWGSA